MDQSKFKKTMPNVPDKSRWRLYEKSQFEEKSRRAYNQKMDTEETVHHHHNNNTVIQQCVFFFSSSLSFTGRNEFYKVSI